MSLATDELVRKAQTQTTQLQALIPQIWASQLERNLRRRAVFEQSALILTDLLVPGAGDTLNVPILPDLGAAASLTEGTPLTTTTLSTASSVAMVPKEYGVQVEITRKALDRIKYDGISATIDRLAYSMSQAIESGLAGLYATVVPGTASKFASVYANSKTSGTITTSDTFNDALLLAGIASLQQNNNVPFDDGYFRLYISPTDWQNYIQDSNVRQDIRWAAPERLLNGEVGTIHGCRVIVTNYIAGATGSVIGPLLENTSVNVNKAMLLAPRALAVTYKRRPEVVIDPTVYDMGRFRRFGVVADFDLEVLHFERGVTLTSAGA